MISPLEFDLRREGERVLLLAPDVGRVTCLQPKGAVLVPGQSAGVLLRLGRSIQLCIPPSISGKVIDDPALAMRLPVSCGDVIYELSPITAETGSAAEQGRDDSTEGAVLSPQSGRYYCKPSPTDPDFISVGDVIEEGSPIGLIEVMKTFAQVPYSPGSHLPPRARVVEILVTDGADVDRSTALIRVEPA